MGRGKVSAGMSYWRFTFWAVVTVAGSWLLGWLPTERLAGEDGIKAMFAGGLLSLMASLLGTLPAAFVRDRNSVEATLAVLKSMALRLGLVLVVALVVALKGPFAPTPLLLWVVISHSALLIVDTWYTCSLFSGPRDPGEIVRLDSLETR